jgi:hypothetical protein
MNQTAMAPMQPSSTTQRQPSSPSTRGRHQEEREDRRDGRGREHHHLVEGHRAAAHVLGHQFGDVGVDGHDLHADADARDEAPEYDAFARVLQRHDGRARAVPQQRIGEHRAAPEAVRKKAQEEGPDEQAREGRRDEARDALEAEKGLRGRCEHTALGHAWGDIAREDQVIDLEEAAEGDQQHHPPQVRGGRQPIHARRDGARRAGIESSSRKAGSGFGGGDRRGHVCLLEGRT